MLHKTTDNYNKLTGNKMTIVSGTISLLYDLTNTQNIIREKKCLKVKHKYIRTDTHVLFYFPQVLYNKHLIVCFIGLNVDFTNKHLIITSRNK